MKKPELFAVIDIGASAIRMVIAEQKEKKPYSIIESLSQSIRLGVDTFLNDVISQESAIATAKTLKKFKRVLQDYQVTNYRIVASSAVQEAKNQRYFLDYVFRHTGFKIEIIETQETCKMIFLTVLDELSKQEQSLAANSLLVDLGTGNARMAFIQNGKMIWIQSLKLGSLRLREILHDIDVQSYEFHKVLHAFIKADLDLMRKLQPLPQIDQLIATGSVIGDIIYYLTSNSQEQTSLTVESDWFLKIFNKYKNVTIEQFIEEHKIPIDKADVLLPAIIVYWYYASIFKPEKIFITDTNLTDGVILDRFHPIENFDDHILASARYLVAKYACDEDHAQKVMELSEEIFLQTKHLHKLNLNYLILLKIAALLHDIGHFVNDREHHKHTQYLIKAAPLTGVTQKQRAIIALVARNHRHYDVKLNENLTEAEKTNVTKMIAILRIANALDQSHSCKVTKVKVKFRKDKNQVVFKITTQTNVPLQKWAFKHSIELFSKLFYVDCLLTESRIF